VFSGLIIVSFLNQLGLRREQSARNRCTAALSPDLPSLRIADRRERACGRGRAGEGV